MRPAWIVLGTDFLFVLLLGVPALYIGNPFEYIDILVELRLASKIIFGIVVLLGSMTAFALTISFYRLLISYNWSRKASFISSLILLAFLGAAVYVLSMLTQLLVAFGGW
jgi:hypothetical protein